MWLEWLDSNQRMSAPKADALPLGDTPIFGARYMYDNFFYIASIFLQKYDFFLLFILIT